MNNYKENIYGVCLFSIDTILQYDRHRFYLALFLYFCIILWISCSSLKQAIFSQNEFPSGSNQHSSCNWPRFTRAGRAHPWQGPALQLIVEPPPRRLHAYLPAARSRFYSTLRTCTLSTLSDSHYLLFVKRCLRFFLRVSDFEWLE